MSPRSTRRLQWSAGLGLLLTHNQDTSALFNGPFYPLVVAPRRLASSPKFTLNFAGSYDFPFSNGTLVRISIDENMTGDQYKEIQNNPVGLVPGCAVWNSRLSWQDADNKWNLFLHGKDITNKVYITETLLIGAPTSGWGTLTYGMPVTFGLGMEYHW